MSSRKKARPDRTPFGGTQHSLNQRGARTPGVVFVAAVLALAGVAPSAGGVTIDLVFRDDLTDTPSFDTTGTLLQDIMEAAAADWDDIIQDSHTIKIDYYWDDLSDANSTLGIHQNMGTVGNRPTFAEIRFDTQRNGTERTWYFDSTPNSHSEFNMSQVLFRDLSSSNKTDFYNGSPPDLLEVSFSGSATATAPSAARNGFDLLSTALHEIGHALGMTSGTASSETSDNDYDFDPIFIFGASAAAESRSSSNKYHLDASDALMFPSSSTGERHLPSATDVFSVATGVAPGWTNIDLARQDFWGGGDGNWNKDFNWEGNAVPGTGDDAWIRGHTVTLSSTAVARNLIVDELAQVFTGAHKLDVGTQITIQDSVLGIGGTQIFVQSGGELETSQVEMNDGGELDMSGGLADVNTVDINTGGELTGKGTVDVASVLVNDGLIRATDTAPLVFQTAGGAVWNLDGASNGELQAINGDVQFISGTLTDAFDGTMTVGQSRTITFNAGWELGPGGVLNLNGNTGVATVSGNTTIDGTVNVNGGTGRFTSPTTYENDAQVNVNDGATLDLDFSSTFNSGSILDVANGGTAVFSTSKFFNSGSQIDVNTSGTATLGGTTTYAGGNIIGTGGTVNQTGNAIVTGNSTINLGTGLYDWDGGGGSSTTINSSRSLSITAGKIDVGTTDGHDGTIIINTNGVLTVNTPSPWRMQGVVNLTSATVAGSTMIVDGTATINALSGTSTISSPLILTSTATVDVAGTLNLSGATTFQGSTHTGAGTLAQRGAATVESSTTIGTTTYDWDGSGSTITTIEPGVTFTINSTQIDTGDPATDGFDGTVNVNSATLAVNTAAPWRMEGKMNLTNTGGGTPTVSGSEMVLQDTITATGGISTINAPLTHEAGTINVDTGSTLNINGTTTFESGANVAVDGEVELNGATTFRGGSYTGTGTIQQDGPATIAAGTTMNVPRYDMDGTNGATALTLDNTLILNVDGVDTGNNIYDGMLNINGFSRLAVNLTTPGDSWTMAGTTNINGPTGFPGTSLDGSNLLISGTVNVDGESKWDAMVDVSGQVVLNDAATQVTLAGGVVPGDQNTLSGGRFSGPGTLLATSPDALIGFGVVSTNVDFTGTSRLLADDGQLSLTGTLVGLGSVVGTADADGTLHVSNAWNTSLAGVLLLNGGRVQGGTITNSGTTAGFGTIAPTQFNNNTLLMADGGQLTLNTTLAPNLDGAGAGRVEAIRGDVLIVDAVTAPFKGTVTVAARRRITFQGGWTLDRTGALILNGGSTSTIAAEVAGGAMTLAGTVNVTKKAALLATTDFASTSIVNLPRANDILRVFADATVQAGSRFTGAGTLVNVAGSTLTLADRSTVSVAISSAGALQIGASPGVSKVTSYSMTKLASMHIDIGGLRTGTEYDHLLATGNVRLDGDLIVSLLAPFSLGGSQQFTIIDVGGLLSGQFIGLGEGALVDRFGGFPLFITYLGNAGRDVVLYTPEPALAVLVGLGALGLMCRRRRP